MEASIRTCQATPADAGIISRIIERSIRVGCALDHRNDPHIVATWIHNKTIEHIQPWLTDPRLYLNIALLHDKPVGVAMAATNGTLAFCYVQPEWFRRGAGQALVRDLEELSYEGYVACLEATHGDAVDERLFMVRGATDTHV